MIFLAKKLTFCKLIQSEGEIISNLIEMSLWSVYLFVLTILT